MTESVRRPRIRVLADGVEIPGLIEAETHSNGYYHADRWAASFALYADVDYGTQWWGDVEPGTLFDVSFAFAEGDDPITEWPSFVTGEADRIEVDLVQGVARVEGRDLTARMIDTKTQKTYTNRTASEVVTEIAQEHGLTPIVTSTSTLVGIYEANEHDRISMGQFSRAVTQWDLLTWLAQQEGFDVFVEGDRLYFQPATDPNADPFVVFWQLANPFPVSNVKTLHLSRSLTLARDIEVTVQSYEPGKRRAFKRTVRAAGAKAASASAGGKGMTERYVLYAQGLTEQQALDLANRTILDLSRHERVLRFDMPGEVDLTPRDTVRLDATDSSWDQVYFIDQIARRLSVEGFQQEVICKNQSPRLTATVS